MNFYAQVASMVRAAGMKLVIENDTMWAPASGTLAPALRVLSHSLEPVSAGSRGDGASGRPGHASGLSR